MPPPHVLPLSSVGPAAGQCGTSRPVSSSSQCRRTPPVTFLDLKGTLISAQPPWDPQHNLFSKFKFREKQVSSFLHFAQISGADKYHFSYLIGRGRYWEESRENRHTGVHTETGIFQPISLSWKQTSSLAGSWALPSCPCSLGCVFLLSLTADIYREKVGIYYELNYAP